MGYLYFGHWSGTYFGHWSGQEQLSHYRSYKKLVFSQMFLLWVQFRNSKNSMLTWVTIPFSVLNFQSTHQQLRNSLFCCILNSICIYVLQYYYKGASLEDSCQAFCILLNKGKTGNTKVYKGDEKSTKKRKQTTQDNKIYMMHFSNPIFTNQKQRNFLETKLLLEPKRILFNKPLLVFGHFLISRVC